MVDLFPVSMEVTYSLDRRNDIIKVVRLLFIQHFDVTIGVNVFNPYD